MQIPIPPTTTSHSSQCTIIATIGCGILSPSCDTKFAPLTSKFTLDSINTHILLKKLLKSITGVSRRIAVKTVTKIAYKLTMVT